MNGEWCYFGSRFTPDFCKQVLDIGLQLPYQAAALGVNGRSAHTDQSYRRSNIRFIDKSDGRFQFLFDALWKCAIEANDQWFNFHISKLDYIQLAEYNEEQQGEYKRHHDVFWMNNDPKYHRKLSAVLQLSDPADYEGGELQLFDLSDIAPNPTEVKKQGTTLFFPSFVPHAVTPVTKGTRYSLAIWFDGPKWR